MSPASNPPGVPLPSVAILGVDALLAARPATPVQLAHACHAAGYAAAYPATWGDELLSTACVRRVAARGDGPAIFCACPHVSDALLEVGPDLARFLVPLVAPPVACARYLRALYGHNRVRITYIGACPGAHDPAIDAHLTPIQFFGVLAQLGIDLQQQPEIFESVLPPDRRRYRSIPGGAPTAEILAREGGGRALEEITDPDWKTELAQRLLSSQRTLFDVAPSLGCHCAGARPGVAPAAARPSVVALEPPRASSEVVDHSVAVDLDRTLPLVVVRAAPSVAPPPPNEHPAPVTHPKVVETVPEMTEALAAPIAAVAVHVPDESTATATEDHREQEAARHRAAAPVVARAAQTVPLARTEGGQVVPRAYAARRRTPSEGAAAIAPPRVMDAPVLEPPVAAADPSPAAVAPPELPAPPQPAPAPSPEKSAAPRPTPRSVTVPLPSEELKPVPPPPAPSHGQAAIVAAAVTVVIAFVALVALRDGAGHVTSESSGMAAPAPMTLESLPPLTFPLPDSTATPAADTSVTAPAETSLSEAPRVESTSVAPPAAPNVTTSPRARRRTPQRRSRAGVIAADTAATRAAKADSIERDAIRRELEHRRARLDSIARSLEPNPNRPDR